MVLGLLGVLAACSGGRFLSEPREAWRQDAEIACLNSGAVSEGAKPIRSPAIVVETICSGTGRTMREPR